MEDKICFVVMGFGRKMDYKNSREVNLDEIYNKVIIPSFKNRREYKLIRADEIKGSEIIDVSMYALLLKADLVIADVTTMNENAIYELGIRHACKPFSTIVMMQKSENIPFDFNHNRTLKYKDYGEKLNDQEAEEIIKELNEYIDNCETETTDSPLYTFLKNVNPPIADDIILDKIYSEAKQKEDNIATLLDKASKAKDCSDFKKALEIWEELHNLLPNNCYITQQLALAQYKLEIPYNGINLLNGLKTISLLNPDKSLDLETLGIAGAIYKRLFLLHGDYDYLNAAIKYYKKGFLIKDDYYTGENYADCLILRTKEPGLSDEEKSYLRFESKLTYEKVVNKIEPDAELEMDTWKFATLAVSYFCLENEVKYKKYEKLFYENNKVEWQRGTYEETLNELKECLK